MSRASRQRRRVRRTLVRLGCVLALSGAATGCSLFGDDSAATTTEPETSSTEAVTTTTVVEAPVIEILDPGAAPRQLLRYDLAAGRTDILVVSGSTIRQESEAGPPTEIVIPDVVHHLELVIDEPVGGRSDLSLEIVSASLAEGSGLARSEVEEIDRRLEELIGLGGNGTISADGRLRSFDWSGLDGFDDTVRSGLEALSDQLPGLVPPLPGSAVGVGASWRATSVVTLDGTPTAVTTTYTLEAMLGTLVSYDSVSKTVADLGAPTEPAPRTSADPAFEVRSAETEAITDATIDLAELFSSTTVAATSRLSLDLDGTDGPVAVEQTITSRLELTTLP